MESQEFAFPFEPYEIQKEFMKNLYSALENGKLGLFESPTGTGKSLSICCAAIQWLKDHNQKKRSSLEEQINCIKQDVEGNKLDDNDWLTDEYERIQKVNVMRDLQKKLNVINDRQEKISKLRSQKLLRHSNKIIEKKWRNLTNKVEEKIDDDSENTVVNEDDEFLLVEDDHKSNSESDNDTEDEESNETKIIFCSRTHSQLSQFINEIKKTSHKNDISVVPLASRQQLCVNESILKLKNQHLINERCLDLQKGKTAKTVKTKENKRSKITASCPFYKKNLLDQLKDSVLVEIKDIEDLVYDGKLTKTCPYYAARASVKESQVIVVPYQTILHKETRRANGINLKNNVIIIDEAHNLLETISHIYSAEIYGSQLKITIEKLKNYKCKYSSRFAAKNLLNLNQLIFIAERILGMFNLVEDPKNWKCEIRTVEEFITKAEIDNLNFRQLLNFCVQSKIVQKLHGFSNKYPCEVKDITQDSNPKNFLQEMNNFLKHIKKDEPDVIVPENSDKKDENECHISIGNSFQSFIAFLSMIATTYSDGRIMTKHCSSLEESRHKFMLLNPANQFTDIVKDARSVILAGGTMQPFSEFRDQLFLPAGGTIERVVQFSCGHVIPPENILPICLSTGPSQKQLNLNYTSRTSQSMIKEIGRILLNFSNIIPGGIVCFFPSYDYEKTVYASLSSDDVIGKIRSKKEVFREPKTTGQVEEVHNFSILENYKKAIQHSKTKNSTVTGAIMFSVVGGKLSEGLNFSDDLGRCVIVIGLPYPNSKSEELQEKIKYLKENVSPAAANLYYQNLCMKAVNQCIGRAVRHAKDYATVVLVDERYSREQNYKALPGWIQTSLIRNANFQKTFSSMTQFFKRHKTT